MATEYEFRHQSFKQKAMLYGVRAFSVILISSLFSNLGWQETTLSDRLSIIGGAFTFIWVYCNLLKVKIEIQELFVPPFDTLSGFEFLLMGLTLQIWSLFV